MYYVDICKSDILKRTHMSITAGDFITKLATMAGMDTSDPALVSILSSSEFANTKIPDDVSSKIQSSLLTVDAAKNNELLRKHFHSEIYNGLDMNLNSVIEKYGLDQEIVDAINGEKKTTEKYNRLIEKVRELETKKSASVSKADKKEVEIEIQNLNNQIKDLNTKLQNAPIERDQYWSDRLKSKEIQNILTSYQFANEKDIPKDVLIETASVLLNRKLNENKMRVEYNAENNSIGLKTESGLDYYKDNSPVSFKSFVDNVLAENKMLNIPGASAPIESKAAQSSPVPNTTIINGSGKTIDASKFFAALDDVANGR